MDLVEVQTNEKDEFKIAINSHLFLHVQRDEGGKVIVAFGYTHHCFRTDAMSMEGIIEEVRKSHPEIAYD